MNIIKAKPGTYLLIEEPHERVPVIAWQIGGGKAIPIAALRKEVFTAILHPDGSVTDADINGVTFETIEEWRINIRAKR